MSMHVPTHDELVTWIKTFEALYVEELQRPIDPEGFATCLEMAVAGAQAEDVRAWVRDSAEWHQKHDPKRGELSVIDVRDVTFVGGPNIGAWPETTKITKVTIGLDGVNVEFTKRDGPDRWPDVRTPGWTGDLQYSLGMCLRINDRWYGSAPIETWFGNNVIAGPIQSPGQIPQNWFYDARWAPMTGYQPKAEESIGLFVCAGDARNNFNPVKERSNIVVVPLPADGEAAIFTWIGS